MAVALPVMHPKWVLGRRYRQWKMKRGPWKEPRLLPVEYNWTRERVLSASRDKAGGTAVSARRRCAIALACAW
eukprot:114716-Pleurochrysis_carterae.AAC.1